MQRSWDRLVDDLFPGHRTHERCFRMPSPESRDGSLRSGYYGGEHFMLQHSRLAVPRYLVVWVLRGSGWYEDDAGRRWPLAPGWCFQRFPDRVHGVHFDLAERGAYWFVGLPPDFQRPLQLAGLGGPERPVFEAGIDTRLLRRVAAFHHRLTAARDDELAPCMAEAFSLMCELHERSRRRASLTIAPWLDRATALLAEDRLDLRAIAAACGLGVSAFRTRFRAATGMAPVRWRIRSRLTRAQELLSGDAPVGAIAAELGYPSTAAFTRQFARESGCSPTRWR